MVMITCCHEDPASVTPAQGRPAGEAFCEFSSAEDLSTAMQKHRQSMGSRYIELFESTPQEMMQVSAMPGIVTGYYELTIVFMVQGMHGQMGGMNPMQMMMQMQQMQQMQQLQQLQQPQ